MEGKMFYETIGRLFSRQQMRRLGLLLESAGMDFVPEAFAGFVVVVCFLASLLTYLIFASIAPLRGFLFKLSFFISPDATLSSPDFFILVSALFSIILASGVILLSVYVMLFLMADARRRRVEEVLPDFLSLSAANVRAGMTIDQALWYAAKPEFGILSDEVAIVAKKTFGGVPFNTAIDYLTERFNSKPVRRAVALIKQAIASGGKLADILEKTAEDSREMMTLRKEISTSLLMYVIFIVFAGAIGTPFLFAISGKLVSLLEGVFTTLPTQSSTSFAASVQGPFIMPSKPSVSSSDFWLFTILTAVMTAIFSSLIIGVISKGTKRDGVPYVPFLLAVSLAVYFLTSHLLGGFLSNIYF
ncbi:MAG: type II secretion system F family protein [Candidatus Micrarchaeota archaeon]|nr:type II secretion system F family protein [Candidatus Micrarchaeota archaeon]